MARLTDDVDYDAGETCENVPRPPSYSGNDDAYNGLRTSSRIQFCLQTSHGYISYGPLRLEMLAWCSSPDGPFYPHHSGFWPYVPGILHSICIFIMNQILFRRIAEILTEYENHKTQYEHDQSLIFKRFLFEAVDAYGCLAYLAFWEGNWLALQSLLLSMFTTDAVRRVTLECLLPWIIYRLRVFFAALRLARRKKTDEADDNSDEITERTSSWKPGCFRGLKFGSVGSSFLCYIPFSSFFCMMGKCRDISKYTI
ncbi:unnamed protein product [Protopolystoma xenopodis]|uniref:Anoctamin n=1 Tax=Protopolystoma xenopodis TaxID=117903 RepID=A0A448W9X8_9PLAT|nr:unnamed protein product [Protopolystoma xenopodis]